MRCASHNLIAQWCNNYHLNIRAAYGNTKAHLHRKQQKRQLQLRLWNQLLDRVVRVAALTVLLIVALGASKNAIACSCRKPEITDLFLEETFCKSDVVLVGEGLGKLDLDRGMSEYFIRVIESLSGGLDRIIRSEPIELGMCGHPFERGTQYLVFASWNPKSQRFRSSICGLTSHIDDNEYIDRIRAIASDQKTVCEKNFLALREAEAAERYRELVRDTNEILIREDTN